MSEETTNADPPLRPRTAALVAALAIGTGAAFFFAGRLSVPEPAPVASSAPPPPAPPRPSATEIPVPPLDAFPAVSFAQHGEDLIIRGIFAQLHVANPTYLDIGAHDPIHGNNTFRLYATGSKGVLVEPNPAMVKKLRAERPRDVVIDKGIGITGEKTAKYYDFGDENSQINTFSTEQAERLAKINVKPQRVLDLPLVDINDVLAEHFPKAPPDLLSVDTEGLELAILKKLDFARFRPRVIVVDTIQTGTGKPIDETAAYLATKHYTVRGGTWVNTVFVADEVLKSAPENHGR